MAGTSQASVSRIEIQNRPQHPPLAKAQEKQWLHSGRRDDKEGRPEVIPPLLLMRRLIALDPEERVDANSGGDPQIRVVVQGREVAILLLTGPLPAWNVRRLKIAIWEAVSEEARTAPWRVASVRFLGEPVDDDAMLEQLGFFRKEQWRADIIEIFSCSPPPAQTLA